MQITLRHEVDLAKDNFQIFVPRLKQFLYSRKLRILRDAQYYPKDVKTQKALDVPRLEDLKGLAAKDAAAAALKEAAERALRAGNHGQNATPALQVPQFLD